MGLERFIYKIGEEISTAKKIFVHFRKICNYNSCAVAKQEIFKPIPQKETFMSFIRYAITALFYLYTE